MLSRVFGFGRRSFDSLSEQEILALLRGGLSNAEISHRLFLSPRTVSTHVERVLRKLGVANRVAAAVHATELELFDEKRVVVSAPRPPNVWPVSDRS